MTSSSSTAPVLLSLGSSSHPYHLHLSTMHPADPPLFTTSDCYDPASSPHALALSNPFLPSPSSSSSLLFSPLFSLPSHHTSITFPPHHPPPPSSSSTSASSSWATSPSIVSLLCLSFFLLFLLLSLFHFATSPAVIAVLSRIHPHFGHAHHLLPAVPAPMTPAAAAAPSFEQAWLLADRRMEGGEGVGVASVVAGKGGAEADDERLAHADMERRMGIISAYLNTPRKHFLSSPSPLPTLSPVTSPTPSTSPSPSPPFLVTAGRYWCTTPADLTRLSAYLSSAARYSDVILLALNLEKDRCSTAEWLEASEFARVVRVVPVLPYFSSTSAMNALLITAFHLHATYILYQSTFITAQPFHANLALSHFSPSTLVVGLCMPSHRPACQHSQPVLDLTPHSCPSNAFAVWHVDTAVMVGWGVAEEGGMIGLVQRAGGERVKAKLVGGVKAMEGIDGDPKRLEYRVKKFTEMARMGWSPGHVTVIVEEPHADDAHAEEALRVRSAIRIGH